jgi:hypothetical protein
MSTRTTIDIFCDSHRGESRPVARLTDCRRVPWPASPDYLAEAEAAHRNMVSVLLPGRPVPPATKPVYGIAVTYAGHQRPGRTEWRITPAGGRVELTADGRRRYVFTCPHPHCYGQPLRPVGERLIAELIDSATRNGARRITLAELRRQARSLAA